jgi:hypothetical protein
MVEKHFKMKGVTTKKQYSTSKPEVEKHFKMKGVTTSYYCG